MHRLEVNILLASAVQQVSLKAGAQQPCSTLASESMHRAIQYRDMAAPPDSHHMPILFFMPWVACEEPLNLGVLRLVPYTRGTKPGTHDGWPQATLDAILGSYGEPDVYPKPNAPRHIQHATLLTWAESQEDDRLKRAHVASRLVQAQYVTFSALAKRRFGSHFEYCNADGYRPIAQCFDTAAPGNSAITVRRRDGQSLQYIGGATAPRFIRPQHVDGNLRLNIDAALAAALLRVPSGDLKDRLDAAIDLCVKANTDSSAMSERTELVLMRVAFETLLNATHQTADLRQRLEEHFAQDLPAVPTWHTGALSESVWRARWPKAVKRPLDAWLQDFCAGRNAVAHGPSHHAPTVWPSHNHLLFASWLFVLMVKKVLAEQDLYVLSKLDQALRRGFEAFFAHDVLSKVGKDTSEIWWSRIECDLGWSIDWKTVFG